MCVSVCVCGYHNITGEQLTEWHELDTKRKVQLLNSDTITLTHTHTIIIIGMFADTHAVSGQMFAEEYMCVCVYVQPRKVCVWVVSSQSGF